MPESKLELSELISHAFYHFGGISGLGQVLGRDFVMRLWVIWLLRDHFQTTVDRFTDALMAQAAYEQLDYRRDKVLYRGEIPHYPVPDTYAESLEACQQELIQSVRDWILLLLARNEPLPDLANS